MKPDKRLLFSIVLTVCLLLLFCICTIGQPVYKYTPEKVIENVYVLKPAINDYRWVTANIVVIINDQDVLVVDSGLLPEAGDEAIKEIRKLTKKPVKYLVNTHWHGDHWQGNGAFLNNFPDVNIISSEEGYHGILRNGMVWVRQFYGKYYQNIVNDYETALKEGGFNGKKLPADSIKLLIEGIAQAKEDIKGIKKLNPKPPTITFNQRMILRCGSREIQLHYLGWGNTTGDAIVYLPKEKILISGDLVVFPSPYESGAFSREWLETSRKLRAFDFNYLIPGHGDVQTTPAYLDYLNSFFEEIIIQVNAAYENGKNSIDEFQNAVSHKSVTEALLKKHPEYSGYVKMLDPNFVPAAVRRAFEKSKESKL